MLRIDLLIGGCRLLFIRQISFLFFLFFTTINPVAAKENFLALPEDNFLKAEDVFTLKDIKSDGEAIVIEGHIARAHYVYRHSLRLVDGKGVDISLELPAGIVQQDEFFGDTEVYANNPFYLRVTSKAAGAASLHWQGCAEAGLCYPPQIIPLQLPADNSAVTQTSDATIMPDTRQNMPTQDIAEDQAVAHRLASLGPMAAILLFLGLGLLLAFTPCSLPMIPIISTLVIGTQANPRRALALSLSYVVAMAATYAAVGVAAGLAGANLQATLQSPWLLGAFAALFLLLAASLFGLFELRIPSGLMNRMESMGRKQSGGSLTGAAGLGLLSALLVGPCMTAPLAGALLYIGQSGSALMGGVALFALGLGMGLPLLVIALFGARVLPKPGEWMERVRVAFGYIMVAMAVLMLSRFLSPVTSLLLWAAWLLSVAVGLFVLARHIQLSQRLASSLMFSALLAGFWSALMLVGAASGGVSVMQPLGHLQQETNRVGYTPSVSYLAAKSVDDVQAHIDEASSLNQWTLIDFYADWCVSCHVIERNVFGDSRVAARLATMNVVRPDVTRNDATDKALLGHWQVLGPPTLILVGPDGQERRAQRVVGEIGADAFLARLDEAGAP